MDPLGPASGRLTLVAVDGQRGKLLVDTHDAGALHGSSWVAPFIAISTAPGGGVAFHTDGHLAGGVLTLSR